MQEHLKVKRRVVYRCFRTNSRGPLTLPSYGPSIWIGRDTHSGGHQPSEASRKSLGDTSHQNVLAEMTMPHKSLMAISTTASSRDPLTGFNAFMLHGHSSLPANLTSVETWSLHLLYDNAYHIDSVNTWQF